MQTKIKPLLVLKYNSQYGTDIIWYNLKNKYTCKEQSLLFDPLKAFD